MEFGDVFMLPGWVKQVDLYGLITAFYHVNRANAQLW
jgi:hypothetical protein